MRIDTKDVSSSLKAPKAGAWIWILTRAGRCKMKSGGCVKSLRDWRKYNVHLVSYLQLSVTLIIDNASP
jgi:hypothetical protein